MRLSALELTSLEIEGFRGYNAPRKFSFARPITVLFGPNGVAKTSTLLAIEWCLFGDVAYLMRLEGRSRDELVNQFSTTGMAKVVLGITDNSASFQISRSKRIGSTKTDFRFVGPDKEYREEDAEQKLYQTIGVTLDDFIRAVYLHQESIKGLLIEDPASRDEALDRLFGLDRIRNIVESIPVKKIRQNVDDLEQKKASLSRKIEGAVEQCQYDLNRLRTKAFESGISEGKVTAELAIAISDSIAKSLDSIGKQYSLPSTLIVPLSDASQIDSFERKVKQALRDYETSVIGTDRITELTAKKSQLEDAMRRYQEILRESASDDDSIARLTTNHGRVEEIASEITKVDAEIEKCQDRRNHIDLNSRLIEDSILVLQAAPREDCPFCRQPIDSAKILKELEVTERSKARQEIAALNSLRSDLVTKRRALEDTATTLQKLSHKKKSNVEAAAAIRRNVSGIIGQTVSNDLELFESAKRTLSEIAREVDEFNFAYAKRAAAFDTIRSDLEKLQTIGNVLRRESELGEINSHFRAESEEIKQLEAAIADLRLLETQLSSIVKVAGQVQAGLAGKIIDESRKEVESYYDRICSHPVYDVLKIEVKPREVRALIRNSYSIKAYNSNLERETFVSSRFSAGQMNCVALSICFALTRMLPLKLRFLILDDPAQSLDGVHKESLVRILDELGRQKQLLLATQDEDLVKLIQSKSLPAEIIKFTSCGQLGPEIEAGT
jgi:DNA repair exonuclease SbcCD ATPase subunit